MRPGQPGRYDTIEGVNEISLRSVIVDVRSTQQIFFDWLAFPRNFARVMWLLAAVCFLIPVLFPIALIVVVIFLDSYTQTAQYLPIRYPAWARIKDPGQLHPATDQPTMASGVMFMGIVDAKDPYERAKQVFLSADDLTRHMLVLGTTGSGKSEFLKGMTFNVLCWASGFFCADAKADNKLPTDLYSQLRMFARDYDFLVINYLLGGLSPTQIAGMRERLSNGLQPATAADADTLVQMTSNMMVKASGDSKTWQERGLNMFRGICRAVCHKRDEGHLLLSMEVLREYLSLDKIEELYIEGWKLANEGKGPWPTPYLGVRSYLEVGLPGFKVDIMLRKHGLLKEEGEDDLMALAGAMRQAPAKKPPTTQSNDTFNQHGYRSDQVYPALSLLIDTYGHIFKRKHPEVDMHDVVVNSRVCVSLIPSLEKGSQEQESLGKLNLALLRVMMSRALGMSVEGDVHQNVDAKITASPTPFALFLDEFAYQFAEGIALTAAQARSLNFFLCALAQDLEKLTEGDRMAEAGAMMANQASKFFMKIIGSDKTHELAAKTLGEAQVAVISGFERQVDLLGSVRRDKNYRMEKRPRIEREVLESLDSGFATFAYRRRAHVMRTFYPSGEVPRVRFPRINRFLQLPDISNVALTTCAIDLYPSEDKYAIDQVRKRIEAGVAPRYADLVTSDVVQSIIAAANEMNPETPAIERGIVLFHAGVEALTRARKGEGVLGGGAASSVKAAPTQAPPKAPTAPPSAAVTSKGPATTVPNGGATATIDANAVFADFEAVAGGAGPEESPQTAAPVPDEVATAIDLDNFDPLAFVSNLAVPITRKPKEDVFPEEAAAARNVPENAQVLPGSEPTVPAATLDDVDDSDSLSPDELLDGADNLVLGETPAVRPGSATTPPHLAENGVEHSKTAAEVKQGIDALANAQIDPNVVGRLGDEVVGLRDATIEQVAGLEVILGASEEEARAAAQNTEKAVAQGLSPLDRDKVKASSEDIEGVFSDLSKVLDQ